MHYDNSSYLLFHYCISLVINSLKLKNDCFNIVEKIDIYRFPCLAADMTPLSIIHYIDIFFDFSFFFYVSHRLFIIQIFTLSFNGCTIQHVQFLISQPSALNWLMPKCIGEYNSTTSQGEYLYNEYHWLEPTLGAELQRSHVKFSQYTHKYNGVRLLGHSTNTYKL